MTVFIQISNQSAKPVNRICGNLDMLAELEVQQNRSSHRKCSVKKGIVIKNFAKFTGKQLCWGLFFNKVAGLRPATLLRRLQQRCFPVNFGKFLKTPIL